MKRRSHPEQRQELLRTHLARGRPQSRSGAAAHDQWNNSPVHWLLGLVALNRSELLFPPRVEGAAIPSCRLLPDRLKNHTKADVIQRAVAGSRLFYPSQTAERGRHASDPAFDDKNTDLRSAALS